MFRPNTVDNTACLRCEKVVYPTDKIGPLKDFTFFHSGCFRCVECSSKLTLKTYYNNQHSQNDKEVYCSTHVPRIGPGNFDGESIGIKTALNVPKTDRYINEQIRPGGRSTFDVDSLAIKAQMISAGGGIGSKPFNGKNDNLGYSGNGTEQHQTPNHERHWGRFDTSALHIQHALKQTEIQRKYSKPQEKPIEAYLDREDQVNLENLHRQEEDRLYHEFVQKRKREQARVNTGIEEEWEIELEKLTTKFERELGKRKNKDDFKVLTIRHKKEKEEFEKHMTLKKEKKKESISKKLLEQERAATAELIDRHSREMMKLIQDKKDKFCEELKGHFENSDDKSYMGEGDDKSHEASLSIPNYPSKPPPPGPPTYVKLDIYRDPVIFAEVDQRAINVAQEDQKTFTDLVRQLVGGCLSDVEKARGIFRWITVKNLNSIMFEEGEKGDTPMGLLRGIKVGTESYHVLFKRLCSYAGLHCVVIKGYSKSAGYQPGVRFVDNRFRNSWNAVYVAGAWRFVQCNWGARHLVNAKEVPKTGKSKSDSLRYEYDDHYFLTDPKEFIYEFFPLQSEWQLLKDPISQEDFEELPFVRSLFFRYQLSFPSENVKSVMDTDSSGAATVRLEMPRHMEEGLIFHYNLKFYSDDKDNYEGTGLKRYVMQSVVGNTVAFRVHAPCPGDLLLDIFANAVTPAEYLTGEPMKFKSVCKFKIHAGDDLSTVMVPLPDCASGEWGPAKALRLFGLSAISHTDALVFAGSYVEIKFRMTRQLTDFLSTLHKNGSEEKKLSKYASHKIEGNVVSLNVTFPEDGQYGMDIYTREVQNGEDHTTENSTKPNTDKHLLTHCCKYLINSSKKNNAKI